jgi:ABC-2 type transport system ATP-binding protein/lipopolysaccharide transport system ATP-binding protein
MIGIKTHDVTVEFPLYKGGSRSLKKLLLAKAARGNLARDVHDRVVVKALDRLNFRIGDGERVALIGRNGAGKSTLLRTLAGIFEPSGGSVEVDGSISTLLESTLGLDFDSTGRENIILRGMYLGKHPKTMRGYVDEIVEFAELGNYIDMPVRTYSAGMMLRLSFATATCVGAEILLMDEWVAAGDMHFIEKAEARLAEHIRAARILVFATHSMELAEKWCNRAFLLEEGHIVADGATPEIIEHYRRRG